MKRFKSIWASVQKPGYLTLLLIMVLTAFPVSAFAEGNSDNVVRVGSFEGTYNVVNEKGERSGYGYEYLQNIAGYTGWTYEYITSNWTDCSTQLENGEIDVLAGISYTDERAENMLFSDMPMGEEKYYIYTDTANTDLTAADMDSFDGKNIGVLKDHIPETVLSEWESKYGMHTNHINISTMEEIMDKLASHEFTPFVQADNSARSKYTGTGLGMSIVKQLVEKMGGTIAVESKLGEGSCFTVVLPFKIDKDAKPEEEKEDVIADISGIRILLVEDNELNIEIAEFMLKDSGAEVEPVGNGLEAVQKFESSEAGTYDVILMDVMMPVMDGLTATKTIRALERQDARTIPIIAMTANAFKEDAEKCLKAGMNAHLAKPLDIETVKRMICEQAGV